MEKLVVSVGSHAIMFEELKDSKILVSTYREGRFLASEKKTKAMIRELAGKLEWMAREP